MFETTAAVDALPIDDQRSSWYLAVVLLTGLLAIGTFIYLYHAEKQSLVESIDQVQVRVIADLKSQEIGRWLRARQADAAALFDSGVAAVLRPLLRDPTAVQPREAVLRWLHSLARLYEYSAVVLLDATGKPLLSTPETLQPLDEQSIEWVRRALRERRVVFSDLYAKPQPRLDLIVPVFDEGSGPLVGPPPLAALLLRIDPETFLYPLLRSWPEEGPRGEIVLARRAGSQFILLGDRRENEAAVVRRLPAGAAAPLLPAGLLDGGSQIVEGVDQRGVAVLAALRPIPQSDWYLLTRVDRRSLETLGRDSTVRSGLIIVLLMLLATLLVLSVRRRRVERMLRATRDALKLQISERTAELEAVNSSLREEITERRRITQQLQLWGRVIASTSNGIVVTDTVQPGNPIISVNAAFERITGYSEGEVVGRNCRFLQRNDRDQPALNDLRTAIRERREGKAILRNYRKDGTLFWNELFIAPVREVDGLITHFIGVITDVSERMSYEAQLEHQANHDGLTQLPNRNLLRDRLEHAIAHARRNGLKIGVLFINLDRFKTVNDSLGHEVGDTLLKAVADRLKLSVRSDDTVARVGGDEFVILLEGLAREDYAAAIARKVLSDLDQPFVVNGHEFFITSSIGIGIYPKDGSDAETLLKNSDTAMYRAKDQGRNTVQFYTQEMNARTLERLVMEKNLRYALERRELELHYQPQVSLADDRIIGVEALLRWRHSKLGLISPAEFVPLAEETGLILPIGEWVIETACAQTKSWIEEGLQPLRVAVNISARQFKQQDIPALVAEVLRRTGLDARCLELEITESLIMHDVDSAIATLRALKGMGVQLAIDDFGTGYSSLSYLKRFPIDRLKIDKSFVSDITTDPDDAAIALAVIAMAHSLKLAVIAEGVETREQVDFLKEKFCNEIQGYYISRPLPPRDLAAFIRENRPLLYPSR